MKYLPCLLDLNNLQIKKLIEYIIRNNDIKKVFIFDNYL